MNKKFIEFMKESIWEWDSVGVCFIAVRIGEGDLYEAKPADLLGWQIRFARERMSTLRQNDDKDFDEINEYFHNMLNALRFNQTSFDKAFKRFIEIAY